jgi:cystathionine beta-lyase/cystathionine gamma-synthase
MSLESTRPDGYTVSTHLVHGPGQSVKWDFSHHVVPPLSSSTTYRLDSVARGAKGFQDFGGLVTDEGEHPVYIYDRLDEPTRSILEGQLAQLEGGESCVTFASGMAAISAALGVLLRSGDEVIAHDVLYGCTHSLLTNWYPRLGLRAVRADLGQPGALARLLTPATRAVYLETPVNPTLQILDLGALRRAVDAANHGRPPEQRVRIVVDNTFATPFGQRPLALGADLVVHSLTKNLGGFGTEVGGAVICPKELHRDVALWRKDFGGILSAKSAWAILVYGLPTLPLRMKRLQYTAALVATWLEGHDLVRQVRYPGLPSFPQQALAKQQMRDFDGDFAPGSMIAFHVDETRVNPVEFLDCIAKNSYAVTLAVSLGHTKTLIESPACMTHSSYGGGAATGRDSAIRLSIGLESPTDITRDLDRALRAVARAPVAVG